MVQSLQVAGCTTLTACACAWWFQGPVPHAVRISAWLEIGLSGAAIFGAIGAALMKRPLWIPAAVALGLILGATWTEWRAPTDVRLSLFESLVSAIAIYGWRLVAPATMAATVGVVLVGLIRLSYGRLRR